MKNIIFALILLLITGCSGTQLRQEFFGFSIKDLENSKKAVSIVVEKDFDTTCQTVLNKLEDLNVTYHKKHNDPCLIISYGDDQAYDQCIDTTQVGLLVKKVDEGKVQVSVYSQNIGLEQFVSDNVFENITDK